ncbi:MAG: TIGR01212 family radical SAM protein [Pirellulales bacterium]|nr:TIGR01212 family radical SAM protein [Pirellulales bacterium]
MSSYSLSIAEWREVGFYYHSLNFFLRKKFGERVWKISLDAGCTCPNRDGTLATEGCVFCDPESFSPSRRQNLLSPFGKGSGGAGGKDRSSLPFPIAEQVRAGIEHLNRRHRARKFIAYFQPATNTYGPIDRLRRAYFEAISRPEVVGMAIGTRPDCTGEEVLDLLAEIAGRTWLVVEYGVQSVHERTLDILGRRHSFDDFLDARQRCRMRSLNVAAHVILGAPGESREEMLETARTLARLDLHSIKPHNLYAVRNTVLADWVAAGRVRLPERDEYVGWLVDFLELIPERVVVERLCGDAPRRYLVGPEWCLDKASVRRAVEAEFRRRGTYQGIHSAE